MATLRRSSSRKHGQLRPELRHSHWHLQMPRTHNWKLYMCVGEKVHHAAVEVRWCGGLNVCVLQRDESENASPAFGRLYVANIFSEWIV